MYAQFRIRLTKLKNVVEGDAETEIWLLLYDICQGPCWTSLMPWPARAPYLIILFIYSKEKSFYNNQHSFRNWCGITIVICFFFDKIVYMLNEVRYRYFWMHNELGTEFYFLDVDNNITYYIYLKKKLSV